MIAQKRPQSPIPTNIHMDNVATEVSNTIKDLEVTLDHHYVLINTWSIK